MPEKFERVYTVTDYWDGPRLGVAAFDGAPHVYLSIWRTAAGNWDDDRYFLSPITQEDAALALEYWTIWQRFATHYHGKVAPAPESLEEWGALPEDLPRQSELRPTIATLYALDRSTCFLARATFRRIPDTTEDAFIVPALEVSWTRCSSEDDDDLVLPSAV